MGSSLTIAQPSFAAGELSPALRARTDLAKYRVGAALMRNYFALQTGGAASRSGTKAILRSSTTFASGNKPRLIPFVFSTTQTYMLEFGHLTMRVIMNGGYVLETGQTVTSVTQGVVTTINKVGHGYNNGDWIWFSNLVGMPELASSPGFVGIVTNRSANAFEITTIDGAAVDSTAWTAFTSGDMARVLTVVSPFTAAQVAVMKYTQNADVMTFTLTALVPRTLTRSSHTSWTFGTITFASVVQPPTGLTVTRNAAGTLRYSYKVTSVYDLTGEESDPTARAANAAGTASAALNQDTGVNNQLDWVAPASGPTPDRYNIYKGRGVSTTGSMPLPTVFGYVGQSEDLQFTDTNIDPDFTRGPPTNQNPFNDYGNPACSTYFGGRKWYAATTNYPSILIASQIANHNNMDTHNPLRADDALVLSLLSNRVNPIKHLISLNSLIALTGDGAWLITGESADEAVTALSVKARPQIYDGCSDVPPLNVSSDVLYMSVAGTKMKTLAYDFDTNLFTGVDITLLASHLFFGQMVTATAYAEEPFSQVYAVRDDGVMNVMSYLKEQDVYAWSQWETAGNGGTGVGTDDYIDVQVIREGNEDVAYYVIKRTSPGVNGGNPFYIIERQASRLWYSAAGVVDADEVWSLDSAVPITNAAPATIVRGLHHMIGSTVSVYADGNMLAAETVAADGTITIDHASTNVLVGLPFTPQLQTLRLDLGEPSVQGKRKKVARVNLIVTESRGITVAPMRDDIAGNSIKAEPYPLRERNTQQSYSASLPFLEGVRSMIVQPGFQVDGSVFIEGTPGVPNTILAVIPVVMVGDDPG